MTTRRLSSLTAEYLLAVAEVERLMPEDERRNRDAMLAGAARLVAYSRALERHDRREMDRLYDEMSEEERAGVQHAHDLE